MMINYFKECFGHFKLMIYDIEICVEGIVNFFFEGDDLKKKKTFVVPYMVSLEIV